MSYTPKSEERLQAQAEAFADKGVKDFSADQNLLLKYSEQLAKIVNLGEVPESLPDELKEYIVKHKDKYREFLKLQKQEELDFLEKNAVLYKQKFQAVVVDLKAKIAQSPNPEAVEGFLGKGSNGSAYTVSIDGEEYVVKFGSRVQNLFEVKPLLRTRGIAHTPELIAFSLADGVKILTRLPGREVTSILPEERAVYSDESIIQLIETVLELARAGIVIDPKASNFIYDEKDGFGVLDYHLSNGSTFTRPEHQVMSLIHALAARKFEYVSWDDTEAFEESQKRKAKVFLPTQLRFLTIMKEKYPQLLVKWQKQHAEDMANPMMSVPELIDRENWPASDPEINAYFDQLESLGI